MSRLSEWRRPALLLFSGALLPLAFAPLNLFPLAFLALIPLFAAWRSGTPNSAATAGFLFGLGQFGVGVSWVFVAIPGVGGSAVPVAVLLTLLFVAVLAAGPALVGYLARRLSLRRSSSPAWLLLLCFPVLWTLGEWFRGWFLTGFPWLSLGYSQIDSPLSGYAPILGVFGISWICAVTAGRLS